MPVPSCVRPRDPSTRWNRSKMRGSSSAGMPVPVSRTASSAASPAGRRRTRDLPLEGELEGVGEEVQDDLLPHVAVHVHRLGQRRAVHDQPQPGLLAGRAEVAGQLRGQRRQVGRLVDRLDPARLDPGEVQQGVDQLQEPQAAAVGRLQPLALPGRQGLGRRPRARPRPGRASGSAACGTRARRWRRRPSSPGRAPRGPRPASSPPRRRGRWRRRCRSGPPPARGTPR